MQQYDHIDDNELIARYRQDGNQQWLGILLQRYTMLLFGVCMKYLKDEEEAKDCVQQIFLKVLTEAGKYQIEFFKSWLYMVAKNQCLMRLRTSKTRNTKELNASLESIPEKEEFSGSQILDVPHEQLAEALDELSPEQKEAVISFYLQKQSYAEISSRTGNSLMKVKSFIQNGKRNLRIILGRKLKEAAEKS